MSFSLPKIVTQENALRLHKEGLSHIGILDTIDCSGLKEFDSSILSVLLSWQKTLQLNGHSLSLEHPPEKLKVLANVYGLSVLLGL